MNNLIFKLLFIVQMIFFLPTLGTATISPLGNTTPTFAAGVSVDIIQGFSKSDWIVKTEGCEQIRVIVLNQKGEMQDRSPLLESKQPEWSFSTEGWKQGTYVLIVSSTTKGCKRVKQIEVK